MSRGGAQTIVMVMFGLLLAVALLKPEGARYKQVWAAGAWSTGLAVFADFVPELVGPLAVLVVIATAAKNPGVLGSVVSGQQASTAKGPAAGAAAAAGPPRTVATPR